MRIHMCSPEGVISFPNEWVKKYNNEEVWNVLPETRVLSIRVILESDSVKYKGKVEGTSVRLYGRVSSHLTAHERISNNLDANLLHKSTIDGILLI